MGTSRRGGFRWGCLLGLVALAVTLVTAALLFFLPRYASSFDPSNPLNLPLEVLVVLFLLGAVGTAVSGIQTLWRIGAFVVRRLRGVNS